MVSRSRQPDQTACPPLELLPRHVVQTARTDLPSIDELGLPDPGPHPAEIDLDRIDYEAWTKEHREWFQKEFPWIFQAEATLRDRGIKRDYLTLLMVSSDIWQFNYPRELRGPMAGPTSEGLTRIAEHYRVALANELTRKLAQTPPAKTSPAETMIRWRTDLVQREILPNDLSLFSLRASLYLLNTRTAAQLWIKVHPDAASRMPTADEDEGVVAAVEVPAGRDRGGGRGVTCA